MDDNFNNYTDINGLITEMNGDAGDTCQREGMLGFGLYMAGEPGKDLYDHAMSLLEVAPGVLVRNPWPKDAWWANPLNLSRDQTRPIVMAAGAYGDVQFLKDNLLNLIKNFFCYPNIYPNWTKPGDAEYVKKFPDIASPENLAEYIRAFKMAGYKKMGLLYPLVLLGDLFKLLGTLWSVFVVDRDPTQADDLNTIISHLQAFKALPTPLSWLSRKIYARFRPGGVKAALEKYFGGPNSVHPMVELYEPLVDKYIYGKN